LARTPSAQETDLLLELLKRHRAEFSEDRKSAEELLKNGESPYNSEHDPVELAAWTSVSRTILNLHETITRN